MKHLFPVSFVAVFCLVLHVGHRNVQSEAETVRSLYAELVTIDAFNRSMTTDLTQSNLSCSL